MSTALLDAYELLTAISSVESIDDQSWKYLLVVDIVSQVTGWEMIAH